MNLDEMILTTIDLNYDQKVALGKKCVEEICNGLFAIGFSEEMASGKICDCIRLFVSADRKCSQEEYCLINDIYEFTDMSYDEFFDFSNGGADPRFIAAMDAFIDALDSELKYYICLFGLCLLVSDDKVTREEYALLKRICE